MAYALVTNVAAGSANGTSVTTGGVDTTGADLIVIVVGGGSSVAVAPTDSKSNTWTALTISKVDSGERCSMFYCSAPVVGAAHTFSIPVTASSLPSICVAAFSGANTSGPLDLQEQDQAWLPTPGTNDLTVGDITPSADGALVVSGVAANVANTWTVESVGGGGGLAATITDQVARNANHIGSVLAYYIYPGAPAASRVVWNTDTATSAAGAIASFHNAAGGGGGGGGGGTTGSGSTLLFAVFGG